MSQPNILLLLADQFSSSLLDNPALKIPTVQALKQQGIEYRACYTSSPLCGPARVGMCTGKTPTKTKGYDNASPLGYEMTYAHCLRKLGYDTAAAGKMHFIGQEQHHGFHARLTTDIYPADLGWTVDWKSDERQEWYHNMASVTQAGPCVRSNQMDFDDEVTFASKQYLYDYARKPAAQKKPFHLTVSLTHPHDPYTISQEYWDRYEGVDIPLPKNRPSQNEQDPHSVRIMKAIDLWNNPVSNEAIIRARRAYYGSCSFVDDQIKQILDVLEKCGLSDDTVVIFTSDHGDMLGEKNLWYKMHWYEDSARVPMIIYHPTRYRSAVVTTPISGMDLLPTMVEIAGGSVDENWDLDGSSVLPLVNSKEPRTILGEYMGEGAVAPVMMIRNMQYKIIICPVDPLLVFDLNEDPEELNNLANSKEASHIKLIKEVQQMAQTRWNFDQISRAVISDQQRRLYLWQALNQGTFRAWDVVPDIHASEKFIRSHIPLDELELRARFPAVALDGAPLLQGRNTQERQSRLNSP